VEFARILAYVTGTVDQELLARNEYLPGARRTSMLAAPFSDLQESPVARITWWSWSDSNHLP